MPPKQPRGPKGQFISKKSLTSLSDASSLNTSTESSPLDMLELTSNETEDQPQDQENSEYESHEVRQQLEQTDEEDQESLTGAPDPEANTLPTFDDQPTKILSAVVQPQKSITPWPVPPATPTKTFLKPIIAKVTPQTSKSKKMSGNGNTPGWFHGKADENAQNFLREVERYVVLNELKTEQGKITVFSTLLSAGSIADTWWNKLDTSHKSTWSDVKTAFSNRWPAITVAEKTGLDYQREILALRLKEEEVGKQITVAGVPTWAHLQFHVNLRQLVNEAGANTTAGLVYQVRENLPTVIKELTTPGLAEWSKFLDEIKALDTNKLREKAETARKKKEEEKMQSARLARLETMQTDAIEVMRLQLQRTNLGSAPTERSTTSSPNLAPRIRYINRQLETNTQQTTRQRQPLTQEERDIMRSHVNDIAHHSDTTPGRAAYDEQLKQWFTKYGQTGRVTETTQFPLRPGSAMICSGECFKCGAHGHRSAECPVPETSQLPIQERIWRSLAARALGNFNRANAVQIDVAFEEEYAQWDQGKGPGSSV